MKISTRLRIAAYICAPILAFVLILQTTRGKTSGQMLTQIPGWLFLAAIGLMIFLMCFVLRIVFSQIPKKIKEAKSQAMEISTNKWRIGMCAIYDEASVNVLDSFVQRRVETKPEKRFVGAACLSLESLNRGLKDVTLTFRPHHMNIKQLKNLKFHEPVSFRFIEKPEYCVRQAEYTEISSYLELIKE